MHNLFDYLAWRGDLTFRAAPLNAVDSLIFSCLAYIHFDTIVPAFPSPDKIRLQDAAERFLSLPDKERLVRHKEDLTLLRTLAQSRRFQNLWLTNYADHFEPEQEKQFAALTILNEYQSLAYVAFRGTDNTLVGWKEDFNLAFLPVIAAQTDALGYLTTVADRLPAALICGGHSKGGNLAVFAAARCPEPIRRRILKIYNHDGPGFLPEMMESPGYLAIAGKIHTLIPQSSVIGMLLDHEEAYTVIHSNQPGGLMQHEPYSWEVLGADFVRSASITASSRMIDHTLKNWVASMTAQQRGEFINGLYLIFDATDAVKFSELPLSWMKNFSQVTESWKKTTPETKQLFHDTFVRLFDAAKDAIKNF